MEALPLQPPEPSKLSLESLNAAFHAQQLQLSSQSHRIDDQNIRIDNLIEDLNQKDLAITNLQLQINTLKDE